MTLFMNAFVSMDMLQIKYCTFFLIQDSEGNLHVVEKHLGISKMNILKPSWSIVIPILNDAKNLQDCVRHLVAVSELLVMCKEEDSRPPNGYVGVICLYFSSQNADSPERLEIIVADGQSKDNPMEVVSNLQQELKSTGTRMKIVFSERGG